MSQEFQRDYLVRLPLPLAQLYGRAHNAKDSRSRHDNTFYLFEALVKLAAAPAIACYLHEIQLGAPRVAKIDKELVHLALPLLGSLRLGGKGATSTSPRPWISRIRYSTALRPVEMPRRHLQKLEAHRLSCDDPMVPSTLSRAQASGSGRTRSIARPPDVGENGGGGTFAIP